ncbi:MAG: UDP-N-acetylglucosamine--N-acetylmuramyl-(pentapeptide) pyrophosphoryl-undecaprenol N-acetylglucosamine transferase [Planctomycetaceae bacterium]
MDKTERPDSVKSSTSPSFIFAGGGSGGHIFPAMAVAAELRRLQSDCQVAYCCGERDIDRQILSHVDDEVVQIHAPQGSEICWRPWSALPKFWRAFQAARQLILKYPNSVVIGTGGYVSVPTVLAAVWLRRPIALLEPNALEGQATSLLKRFASLVCTGLADIPVAGRGKYVRTGVALRSEFNQLVNVPYSTKRNVLLILGGSQGATTLNDAVVTVLQKYPDSFTGWEIVHQTGNHDVERMKQQYAKLGVNARVGPFLTDLWEMYQKAGLVISRCGATTLAELACAGLPTVLLPHEVSVRNHQWMNAKVLFIHRATPDYALGRPEFLFAETVSELLQNEYDRKMFSQAIRKLARPEASRDIARHLLDLSGTNNTAQPGDITS